jgi:TolB-like protein/tetratricopeptide (TPR) repeat protein
VFHVLLAYLSAGVAVALAFAELYDDLGLPDWTTRFVLLLLILGLPIALVLAWAYELRPEEGGAPETEEPWEAAIPTGSGRDGVPGPDPVDPGLVSVDPGLDSLHPDLPPTQPGPSLGFSPGVSPDVSAGFSPDVSAETFQRSIVVLPFDNLSPDPGDAYFSDGLTEEIISDLSGIHSLRVISRTSAMLLKGSGKDLRAIGRELSVRYVLEGSVRKAGDRLRVTAQLIDAETDAHLWSEKYDGELGEVFEIQESVARAMVAALSVHLTEREDQSLTGAPLPDVRAYDAFLRARGAIWTGTADALDRAEAHLRTAQEIMGENALLEAAAAYVQFQKANFGYAQDEAVEAAERRARRALELDSRSALAHVVLGAVMQAFRGDLAGSLRHLDRALELSPGDLDAMAWLLNARLLAGRNEQALTLATRLVSVDPLSPMSHMMKALALNRAGIPEESLEPARKAYTLAPGSPHIFAIYSLVLASLGESEELTRLRSVAPPKDSATTRLGLLFQAAVAEDTQRVSELVNRGLEETAQRDPDFSLWLADVYAAVGEEERAFEWLENAADRGFCNYPFVAKHDPLLANIRDDPDFQRIAARMKEEWQSFDA